MMPSMMRLLVAVTTLLSLKKSCWALDAVLQSIECDESLPIFVVPATFSIQCNSNERCSLSRGDTATIQGHFVFKNIPQEGDSTTVYLRAHIETVVNDYALVSDGTPIDLCDIMGSSEQEQNDDNANTYDDDDAYVDDAYFQSYQQNNADKCPQNGVYEFEYNFLVPPLDSHMWWSTGWRAYGDLTLATLDEVVGECQVTFETKCFGISSRAVFCIIVSVVGISLFVGVVFALRTCGGFLKKDDPTFLYWLSNSDTMNSSFASSCAMFIKKRNKTQDLDATFDSDSSTSFSEKVDSLDTTFETSNNNNNNATRVSPIRVRELLRQLKFQNVPSSISPPSPGLPTEPKRSDSDTSMEFKARLFQKGEQPPSPIRADGSTLRGNGTSIQASDPPAYYMLDA